MRGLFSGIMALVFAWVVFSRYDNEIGTEVSESERQKYLPYIPSTLLPSFLIGITILGCIYFGFHGTARMTLSSCFAIFLHIGLYYLVLLLVLPFLRKIISARACAMLWLIPNYLYIIHRSYMELPSPLFVITAKGNLAWILFGIWMAGFAVVLIRKCVEHLIFRHQILRNSKPVTDPDIIAVWNAMLEDAYFKKPKFMLVTSPNVSTPLTIGLSQRSTRVVLPEKKYHKEDLELILRHELIHIGREDAWNKFFMVFCAAMCWFNPLMWIAMRKSADDIELSCDETVLLGADDATRKQYAILLLNTAGDERGFTTCLSATANAMRYRLQNIAKPVKRRSGALIVGAAFFILCMTSGYVALAYDDNSSAQILYPSGDISSYWSRDLYIHDNSIDTNYEVVDEAAFHEYLSGLTFFDLTGNYSYSDSEKYVSFFLETPKGVVYLNLFDDAIKVIRLYGADRNEEIYYIPEGLDWDLIHRIIIPHPALEVHLEENDGYHSEEIHITAERLWTSKGGERTLAHYADYPDGYYPGVFGCKPSRASFVFSQELAAPFTVLIESWDYSTSYSVSQTEINDGFSMDLPDYPAHYTVFASFYDKNGTLYEAEFGFNVGEIDSQ